MTMLSAHFAAAEFVCRHCGRLPPDGIPPALVHGLEALRSLAYPKGLALASAYRCPEHNASLPGAARDSQHLYGAAVDVAPRASLVEVRALHAFSGLGWQWAGSRQVVRHVDVRHAGGHNATGGTTGSPTTWEYLADGTRR